MTRATSPGGAALIVSAGEVSGDWMAARVLEALDPQAAVGAFGMGGPALRAAGLETVCDAARTASMGVVAPLSRVGGLAAAARRLVLETRSRRPRAALLVGFSEFNALLGRHLRRRGTTVLWYAPPQIWAWRPGRAQRLAEAADHLALLLPFEEPYWAATAANTAFVGHPSFEADEPTATRAPAGGAPALALLPGSRRAEVRRHLPVMLSGCDTSDASPTATLFPAPGLDADTLRWATALARRRGVRVESRPTADNLGRHDLALCASGTATLDCVAAGVPPVIVYRTDPVSYAVARRLVTTPHIGLPNVALGAAFFPELVQGDVSPRRIGEAIRDVMTRREALRRACREVRARLSAPGRMRPSELVARTLETWLGRA